MAGEQDIDKGGEKIKLGDSERLPESTAEDAVIGGDRKLEHQQRHQEMKDSGRSFYGMNALEEKDGIEPADDESVTIVALNPDGSEVKASGKTGLNERNLAQASMSTSFRHGLKINPGETAQEILKVVQNPPASNLDSSKLLVSNVLPNAPNLDQIQQFKDIQTDAGSYQVIDPAIAQLPDLGKMLLNAGDSIIHPHKNELNKFLDPDAANLAMNKLPRLSWYANRNATIGPQLLLGLIRNETENYIRGKDDVMQDVPVALGGEAPLQNNPTLGPAQVSLKNQRRLVEKYPDLFGDPRDYPKTSLSPYFATLLAGALLDQNIQTFEKWDKQLPSEQDLNDKDTRLLYEHAYPKWREGLYTEALIRSYNPGDGSRHVRNVQRHIDTLNSLWQSK